MDGPTYSSPRRIGSPGELPKHQKTLPALPLAQKGLTRASRNRCASSSGGTGTKRGRSLSPGRFCLVGLFLRLVSESIGWAGNMLVQDFEVAFKVADNHVCHTRVGQMLFSSRGSGSILDNSFLGVKLEIVSGDSDVRAERLNLDVAHLHRDLGGIVHVLALA